MEEFQRSFFAMLASDHRGKWPAAIIRLDEFIAAMRQIAREARSEATTVTSAPTRPKVQRLDEVRAARKPLLRWRAESNH